MSVMRSLVISFPRSGMNWLRHCTEFFSGARTPGRPHLVTAGPLLFDRTHDVRKLFNRSDYVGLYDPAGAPIYQRVALLLREPIACFVSHYLVRKEVSFAAALENFGSYTNNIIAFDELPAPEREVFYFEDFVNDEAGTFEFLRFFGVDPGARAYDFNKLISSSREWYRASHGLTKQGQRPELSEQQRADLAQKLRDDLGDRFERYLGRYFVEDNATVPAAEVGAG